MRSYRQNIVLSFDFSILMVVTAWPLVHNKLIVILMPKDILKRLYKHDWKPNDILKLYNNHDLNDMICILQCFHYIYVTIIFLYWLYINNDLFHLLKFVVICYNRYISMTNCTCIQWTYTCLQHNNTFSCSRPIIEIFRDLF